ncbi:hydrogenase small subunit [Deferrisoma camini]|uniref:hydrogenase small subunit n=1 Tax=Deferrisoma camini TaxID=1035120 RepID=UPI00046D3057|nr:hydrogenase small subunit [Deferrisoma camini]
MAHTRREFLRDAAMLAAGLGLGSGSVPRLARALEGLAARRPGLVWLQGQSCSGCSVSLLNGERPGPAELLTRYFSVWFHPTLSAATGDEALAAVDRAVNAGGYLLAVEGAMPLGMPRACTVGDEPIASLVSRAAARARAVLAVGTCASFGGIPAAAANPTGAAPVSEVLARAGVSVPHLNVPGCPAHPHWIVGTAVLVLHKNDITVDEEHRPTAFFGRPVHDQCPHFARYERQEFARTPGEDGCLFKLGCQGALTHADCPWRGWNGGTNWCVRGRAPCTGCARPGFARDPAYPFFRLNEGRTA